MAMRGVVRDLVGVLTLKGGPGSGHRGHAGRPGSVGGSVPGAGSGGLQHKPSERSVLAAKSHVAERIWKAAGLLGVSEQKVIDKVTAQLEDDLTNPISIRTSSSSAVAILQEGRFKTQFETGTSGGSFAPKYRKDAEDKGLGAPHDLAVEKRPVYGYYSTGGPGRASQYGTIEFVLKDKVKTRSTYTIGDSLSEFTYGGAAGAQAASSTEAWDTSISQYYKMGVKGVGYIEAQIQGGVSVKDIAKIVVHTELYIKRERDAFTVAAKKAGILVEYK